MQVNINDIPGVWETRVGLPRPDWEAVARWVQLHVGQDQLQPVWVQLARQWVERLADALPGGYSVAESDEFLLLAKADPKTHQRWIDWCEQTRHFILETLDGVANAAGYGKHVVLALDDHKIYYDYIADTYPESGEFGLSAGMSLTGGYDHTVVCMTYQSYARRTIAHELTHELTTHLPLPTWLSEGIAMWMEDMAVESSEFYLDRETMRKHRKHWNVDTIQEFWSGESFFAADDAQRLSYDLAQVLFRNLLSDHPKHVAQILATAHFEDAGNQAILDACKVPLAERAAQFLGPGDWSPREVYDEQDSRLA